MNRIHKTDKKRTSGKSLLLALLTGFIVIVGWYGVTRLISPWQIVRTFTLADTPAESSPYQPQTLRVGTYNIAHGRGGKFGASDWDGGNRAADRQIAQNGAA